MVQPILKGRMGNQMFQIAAAIGYALNNGQRFMIPPATADMEKWPHYFQHLVNVQDQPLMKAQIYVEEGFHYRDLPHFPNIILDGYFQSEKYFAHCADSIRSLLFPPGFKNRTIEQNPSVSVHVRRGDYVTLPNHHPVVPWEYYQKAIWYFIEKGNDVFTVFSDDIEWCKKEFEGKVARATLMFYETVEKGIIGDREDMAFMSRCDHHIIANSSFSWWAAWLNSSPKKIVVAPKTWFGPALSHLDTKDLLPENWIKL